MLLSSSGLILGGNVGGIFAAAIIPAFSWPAVFITGAVAPQLIALVMLTALPESLQFLALRARRKEFVRCRIECRHPARRIGPADRIAVCETPQGASAVGLLRDRLGVGPVLLWPVNS